MPAEYESIVEFSFNEKSERFVIRFLDGHSYTLDISDLPKKMQTKKPDWDEAYLSGDKSTIIVRAGKEIREIPAYMIHSRGKEV